MQVQRKTGQTVAQTSLVRRDDDVLADGVDERPSNETATIPIAAHQVPMDCRQSLSTDIRKEIKADKQETLKMRNPSGNPSCSVEPHGLSGCFVSSGLGLVPFSPRGGAGSVDLQGKPVHGLEPLVPLFEHRLIGRAVSWLSALRAFRLCAAHRQNWERLKPDI